MKRTELEKRERKLRQRQKKEEVLARKSDSGKISVNDYIEGLFSLLRYDYEQVFNAKEDIDVLELFEDMKHVLPEKQWENVIKKAIKKTNVSQKDQAIDDLKNLLDQA